MAGSATGGTGSSGRTTWRLPRTVIALAAVSFLTDASSEMIYPLLPVFLSSVLGASALAIGAIEGAAESTAALLKLASGWWSDRLARRKLLVVIGYGLASLARPLVGLAGSVDQVLALRLIDRVGKGIRTAPRDALIADAVEPAVRGRAYGFHRAADHAGAVVGPLLASGLLYLGLQLRSVFLLAAVPAALALVTLIAAVPETKRERPHLAGMGGVAVRRLGGSFWGYLLVLLIFTLGNSSDAFLLLRATQLGVPASLAPLLWSFLHVVKSLSSTPGGILSDKLGRRPMIVTGWIVYAAVYAGFALASQPLHAWLLFAAYGIFFGLTEGVEKALVADLVPPAVRGAAFGWYNLAIGIGALPASLVFGAIWDRAGSAAAFGFGASLALLAALGLGVLRLRRHP
jgi:MFS family permease